MINEAIGGTYPEQPPRQYNRYKPEQTLEMLQRQACTPKMMERRLFRCCEDNPYCPVEAECKKLYCQYVDATDNPRKTRKCKDPTFFKNGKRHEIPQGGIIAN